MKYDLEEDECTCYREGSDECLSKLGHYCCCTTTAPGYGECLAEIHDDE